MSWQQNTRSIRREWWSRSSSAWKSDGVRFTVPAEPWVERETSWHNYYLRSNLTYDSFFREHIISQGHVYQYIMGFQGAARDPLQHTLPFIFSNPEMVGSHSLHAERSSAGRLDSLRHRGQRRAHAGRVPSQRSGDVVAVGGQRIRSGHARQELSRREDSRLSAPGGQPR